MCEYRNLTPAEIEQLERAGNRAADWSRIRVAQSGFAPEMISGCRFGGQVWIGCGAELTDSYVANYRIGDRTKVRSVVALECRCRTRFGNGTQVRAVNENGGRSVAIYEGLSAQVAYLVAMWRHRKGLAGRYGDWVERYAESRAAAIGEVGDDCTIVGARFIREMRLGCGVTVEGASVLENGTMLDGSRAGVDVKAFNFIAAEGSVLDTGALIDNCFVGEQSIVAAGFTAGNVLFFANCHCENGEASAVFAGPFTVSHHKSSLLIAGIFSFFNAGSGTNQSNHLFKNGAVHQSVHRRGCKFASNGYVMSPAAEGAYTMVMGRHVKHHDTSALPFSYLVESGGASLLMPGLALRSCGTWRDMEKWRSRDRRTVRRERIDFDEYNPFIAGAVLRGIGVLRSLHESQPELAEYHWSGVTVKATMLRHGIRLYEKYLAAALGAMLETECRPARGGSGEWVDMAGQYAPLSTVEALLDRFESGCMDSPESIDAELEACGAAKKALYRGWALGVLTDRLGHEPSGEELRECIAAGREAHRSLLESAQADSEREFDGQMHTGYGTDAPDDECGQAWRDADFGRVHGIQTNEGVQP